MFGRAEGEEWIVYDTHRNMQELSSDPATPPSTLARFYAKAKSGNSELFYINDAGSVRDLSLVATAVQGAGTGTATRVPFWLNSTTITDDSSLYWDNVNKDLLLGVATLQPFSGVRGRGLAILRNSPTIAEVDIYGFGLTGVGSIVRGIVGRGTYSSPTASQTDDSFSVLFNASDNTPGIESTGSAIITLACGEAQTTTAHGSYIDLGTTALGTTTRATRFRVGPSGQWGIGGATFGSAGSMFRSGGASAAPTWSTNTWPDTTTINQILYATSANVIGSSANLLFDGTQLTTINERINGYIDFAAISAPANPAGSDIRLYANATQGFTRVHHLINQGVDLIIGRDQAIIVRNVTGSSLTDGQVVYVSGTTGTVPQVSLARSNTITTLPGIGVVMGTITNNSFGYVHTHGIHSGMNTSAFTAGDIVYVSPSVAGGLTATKPVAPFQEIGVIVNAGVGNGALFLDPATPTEAHTMLDANEHSDTVAHVPVAGDLIYADATPKWTALAKGSNGQVLELVAGVPAWQTLTSTPSLIPGGRLTLTSATPVLASDVTGSTSIYYALYTHDRIPIFDGSNWTMTTFTELTNTTTDNTKNPAAVANNSNYDLFVWNDSGTLRLGRGPAWTSDTARGTGAGTTELERINGIWMNKQSITNGPAADRGTYVGTVRSNGTATIDWIANPSPSANATLCKLYVWNMYNRVSVTAITRDSTDSWTYATATWREANGSSTFQVNMVIGQNEDSIQASYSTFIRVNDTGAGNARLSCALDTTSAIGQLANVVFGQFAAASNPWQLFLMQAPAFYGLPGIGFHFVAGLEYAAGGTFTNFGNAGAPTNTQTGLQMIGRF